MPKPQYMPDDIYEQLTLILKSPWYNWKKACGIKHPKWRFWKCKQFKAAVNVTRDAIRHTLSYEFYPETYIPRVELERIDGINSLTVHTWGKPWEND